MMAGEQGLGCWIAAVARVGLVAVILRFLAGGPDVDPLDLVEAFSRFLLFFRRLPMVLQRYLESELTHLINIILFFFKDHQ